MGRRRKGKRDEEVVKTQRDSRRAERANDDTLDLTDEETVFYEAMEYTTAPISQYLRNKARKLSRGVEFEVQFPFLRLPPEIRNIIYRRLLVSRSHSPIRLDRAGRLFTPGGIETAILLANHTIYQEAVKILYDENLFLVCYSKYQTDNPGVSYRVDDPRDASITSRQLRNGRSVDMISHKGLIYREVFYRLRNVELHVDLFDRAEMCDHMTLFWTGQFRSILESLYKTITDSSSKKLKSLRTTDKNWSVVIHSVGLLGLGTMYNMLRPILSPAIAKAVGTGKLQMILVGNFSASWETIFSDMIGPGFSADGVNVIEEDDLDPVDLDDFFDD